MGTWKNIDSNTRGWTKIEIWVEGNIIFAHFWGKCHPSDCDAGIASTSYEGNPVKLFIDLGFATRDFTLLLNDVTLHLTTINHYIDTSDSGVSYRTDENDYRK